MDRVREALEAAKEHCLQGMLVLHSSGPGHKHLRQSVEKIREALAALDEGWGRCSVLAEIEAEYQRAKSLHARMNGQHEAYAVILEEVDELWDEVRAKKLDRAAFRKECVQIAAMCVRAIKEVADLPPPPKD